MAQQQRKPARGDSEPGDIETETRMILSAVARMEGKWGAYKIAVVICGGEREWLFDAGLDELSVYGLLSHLSQLKVIAMLGALEDQQLIRRGEHKTLELTLSGTAVMLGKRELTSETKQLLEKARSVSGVPRPAEQYHSSSPTLEETLNMLRRGLSPQMIAKKRGFELSTIADHLMTLADRGAAFELNGDLDGELLQELREKAGDWKPGDALTPVREALDEEECEWGKLKLHLIQVFRER